MADKLTIPELVPGEHLAYMGANVNGAKIRISLDDVLSMLSIEPK